MADIAILSGAFFLAYLPALNVQLSEFYVGAALTQLPFVVLVQFSCLFLVGAYSILWRYVSIGDIKVFAKASIIAGTILIAFRLLLTFTHFNLWQVPVSVILIDTVLAFGGLLGVRILRRFIYELGDNRSSGSKRKIKRKPALLVGRGADRGGAGAGTERAGRRRARGPGVCR